MTCCTLQCLEAGDAEGKLGCRIAVELLMYFPGNSGQKIRAKYKLTGYGLQTNAKRKISHAVKQFPSSSPFVEGYVQ